MSAGDHRQWEWGVQRRTDLDRGFEASGIRLMDYGGHPYTQDTARDEVRCSFWHPDDETGLPPARVVKRFVGPWRWDEES